MCLYYVYIYESYLYVWKLEILRIRYFINKYYLFLVIVKEVLKINIISNLNIEML